MSLLSEFLDLLRKNVHSKMTIHHTVGETEWVFYSNLVGRYSLCPNLALQTPGVSHYSMLVNSCPSSPSPVQAELSGFLFGWGVNDLNAWSNHPRPPAQSYRCCQVLKIKVDIQSCIIPFFRTRSLLTKTIVLHPVCGP